MGGIVAPASVGPMWYYGLLLLLDVAVVLFAVVGCRCWLLLVVGY